MNSKLIPAVRTVWAVALVGALAGALLTAGCAATTLAPQSVVEATPAAEFAAQLQASVTLDAMMGHLQKLQEIADANGGTRALGTPGYDASVDYVADTLRQHGFEVSTPEFTARVFTSEVGSVSIGGATMQARALEYSPGTAADGVSGQLVAAPVDDTPGCTASDYDGLSVRGAVVLVDRGFCPFKDKQAVAAERGAVAVIIADNIEEEKMGGTLGEKTDVKIPVVSVTRSDGVALRAKHGTATVKVDAHTDEVGSRNVIAQTKTGSTENVVMLGAHLDSVPEGPGINDNGSGVAAVLETAIQLTDAPAVRNAVRFGFWGAEEVGLVGSTRYVESLDVAELKKIALYVNFDMLGSPNPGYFTYDGDQSMPLEERGRPVVPEGSAGIERTLVGYLESAGKTPADTSFDGRSDYDAFTRAGVPAGGLASGAEVKKTKDEAGRWGGSVDEPFDPNYHEKGDNIDNIDRGVYAIMGAGVGYVAGLYAQDITGRNGVPQLSDRTRHALSKP